MVYLLFFALVLLLLPLAHGAILALPGEGNGAVSPVFFCAGVCAWILLRVLTSSTDFEFNFFLGAGAALGAVLTYDKLFAVRFQEWIEDGEE